MRLFLDDERAPPSPQYQVVYQGWQAVVQLVRNNFAIEELSLDHDLGDGVPTGYDVAAWLEKVVLTTGVQPPKILRVHSANPVGRARILQAFQSIARYCEANGLEIPQVFG
jgi:Cyclic-phosphate processing Receiver domain